MRKKILHISIVLSVAIVMGCGSKKPPVNPNAPVPVNLVTVDAKNVIYYDEYPATTVALNQVDIRPQVQGYITSINFKEGGHVTKGSILYEIDKSLYQASYNEAQANLKVAQGNLDQAKKDEDRYNYLNTYDAIAKQVLDHAVITRQNAENQVEAAGQSMKIAQANLDYSTIRAPFDGTIGFSQVKIGNMVTVGQTVLNTISSDDPMGVDFVINEKQLERFYNIQHNKQTLDSLFTLLLPNDSLYSSLGKIDIIDRGADPLTGTIKVRLTFTNNEYSLRPGISCVVRVHNEEGKPQLFIPAKAIVEQMGEYFVYVAKDTVMANPDTSKAKKENAEASSKSEKDSQEPKQEVIAVQKKVMTGPTIGANIIIKSGLKQGDRIVTDGVQKLHDGSPIVTSNKPAGQGKNENNSNQYNLEGSQAKSDSSKHNQQQNK